MDKKVYKHVMSKTTTKYVLRLKYSSSFLIVGILVVICIKDHIFHGGGLPSAHGQVVRPPNFSPDAIPETSFTCEDKITGGYYADLEADCQLFHVCVQVSEYEVKEN